MVRAASASALVARGLLDLASSTRQRIRACVDDRAEAMRGQLLDVTSWPPLAGRDGRPGRALVPRFVPWTGMWEGKRSKAAGQTRCPRQDSNLRHLFRRQIDHAIRALASTLGPS